MTARIWAILKVASPIIVALIAAVPPLVTALKPAQASKPQEIHVGPGGVLVMGDVRDGSIVSPISYQGWLNGVQAIKEVFMPAREQVVLSPRVDEDIRYPSAVRGPTHPAAPGQAGLSVAPINSPPLRSNAPQKEPARSNAGDQSKDHPVAKPNEGENGETDVERKVYPVGGQAQSMLYSSDPSYAYSKLCPDSALRSTPKAFAITRDNWDYATYGRMRARTLRIISLEFPIVVFRSAINEEFVRSERTVKVTASERIEVKLDSNYGLECIYSIDQTLESPRKTCWKMEDYCAPEHPYEKYRREVLGLSRGDIINLDRRGLPR